MGGGTRVFKVWVVMNLFIFFVGGLNSGGVGITHVGGIVELLISVAYVLQG